MKTGTGIALAGWLVAIAICAAWGGPDAAPLMVFGGGFVLLVALDN